MEFAFSWKKVTVQVMNTRSGFEKVIDTPLGGFYNIRIFVFWKLMNTLILSIKIDSKTETAFVINKEKFYGLLLCWLISSWFGEKCSFDWQNLKIFIIWWNKSKMHSLAKVSGLSKLPCLVKLPSSCFWPKNTRFELFLACLRYPFYNNNKEVALCLVNTGWVVIYWGLCKLFLT